LRPAAANHYRRPTLADHCPPGLQLDETELKKRFHKSGGRSANLHVPESGRSNQRYATLCRDYLRTHPVAAAAFVSISLGGYCGLAASE